MRSTGVEALESRLGGIDANGAFLVLGPEGVGKSVIGLHFLITGMEQQERCLLVTGSDRATVDGRGVFVGFSPGSLSEHPGLEVVDVREAIGRLGLWRERHAAVEALRRLVNNGPRPVTRIVIDEVRHFLQDSHTPQATARALMGFLAQSGASSYLVASNSDMVALSDDVLHTIEQDVSAVLEMEPLGRGRKRLSFRSVRQHSFSTEPFLYTLRSGGGVAEDLPAYEREVRTSLRGTIAILDESAVLPPEVVHALSSSFEVELYNELQGSLVKLLEARYGVLVLGVDPYDPERAFNLTYTLRKAGNGAPILFVAPSRGLRSMTRSRGLRMGGDDFVLSELPPAEIVERIRISAARGHHRRNGSVRPDRQLQPRDDEGELRPMKPEEMAVAVRELVDEAPTPFFALALLDTRDLLAPDELWMSLRRQARLNDGDLVSILADGRVALLINQVDQHLAGRVLTRIQRSHPALSNLPGTRVLTSPLEEHEIERWATQLGLERTQAGS